MDFKKVVITGDIHGDFSGVIKAADKLPEPSLIIISGDFGGVWAFDPRMVDLSRSSLKYSSMFDEAENNLSRESKKLDELSSNLKGHTLMFIDGNHENFDRLYSFPEVNVYNAKAHQIRSNILHIKRGEIVKVNGMKLFMFGGAYSHDISGGLVDIESPNAAIQYMEAMETGLAFRTKRVSWWKEEKPSDEELDYGYKQIEKNPEVDYVVTHQTNMAIESKIGINYKGEFGYDFHDFLRAIDINLDFKLWFFGHYHDNILLDDKHMLLYEKYISINKEGWEVFEIE